MENDAPIIKRLVTIRRPSDRAGVDHLNKTLMRQSKIISSRRVSVNGIEISLRYIRSVNIAQDRSAMCSAALQTAIHLLEGASKHRSIRFPHTKSSSTNVNDKESESALGNTGNDFRDLAFDGK